MTRAVLPSSGYRRPDRVDPSGLLVSVIGTTGAELGPFDFSGVPAHGQLRSELIAAFVTATSPEGRWRSAASMDTAFATTLAFLRSLDRLDISVSSLCEFGPEAWWTWRADREATNRWPGQVNIMRVLLKQAPQLQPLTRRALLQRTHKPRQRLYGSYTTGEFERIRRRSAELVRAAESRIAANASALDRHLNAGSRDGEQTVTIAGRPWTSGELLAELMDRGRLEFGASSRTTTQRQVAALLDTGDLHPTYALIATRIEIVSLMVLLVCDRGYNLSTLESLTVPELASAAGAEEPVLVAHLDKPRRGHRRFFSNSFTGPEARVLRLAMAITDPARECLARLGHRTDQLLISGTSSGVTGHPTRIFVTNDFTNGGVARRWDKIADIRTDSGELLHLHLNRLRLSEQVINRKASQNSDAVSEDVYRRPDALSAHLVEDVILDGQADAVAHAAATVKMRYERSLDPLHLRPATAAAIEAGSLDTATGACLDFTHSPFTEPGNACTASFLMCLACPNAIATPAHLPRLLTLREALTNLASVDPDRFDLLYREHHTRLEDLLSSRTTEAERELARATTTDVDRDMIERLLRRELDS